MFIKLFCFTYSLALLPSVMCMGHKIPRSRSCDSLVTLDKLEETNSIRKIGVSDIEHRRYLELSEAEEATPASFLTLNSAGNEKQISIFPPLGSNDVAQNNEGPDFAQDVFSPDKGTSPSKHINIVAKPRALSKNHRGHKSEICRQRLSMEDCIQNLYKSQWNSYYRSDREDEDEVKADEHHPSMRSRYYQSDTEDIARIIDLNGDINQLFSAQRKNLIRRLSEHPDFPIALKKLQQNSDEPTHTRPQDPPKTSNQIVGNQVSLHVIPDSLNLLQQISASAVSTEDEEAHPTLRLIANIAHPMPRTTKIILSISGGGSRGVIPTIFLRELRSHLFVNTDDYWTPRLPIDLYAGTSVGALIATAENLGQMREVYADFPQMAKTIFRKNWWNRLLSIISFGAFGTYDPNGRLEVIKTMLNGKDGKDLETEQLMPIYILNTREDYLYNSKKSDIPLVDALMGTSAAPTYFPPHIVRISPTENRTLLDGGLWKNRPDALAYFSARAQYPNDYIKIISIGTGKTSKVDNFDDYPIGLIGWASKFVDIAMDSSSQDAMVMIRKAKKFDPYLKYYDLNVELDRADIKTDVTDDAFFDRLTNATVLSTKNIHSDFNAALEALQEKLNDTN